MSTSKNKSLIFIIAVLLLTNIAVLGYFLWFKKPSRQEGPGHGGIETALRKDVGFNDQQIAQYKLLKEEQWKNFRPMFDNMRKAKDSLFSLLSNENINDSLINITADVIAQRQKEIDLRMFNHFRQIRALCTPNQLPKYDSLIQRMMKKMGRPHREPDRKEKK